MPVLMYIMELLNPWRVVEASSLGELFVRANRFDQSGSYQVSYDTAESYANSFVGASDTPLSRRLDELSVTQNQGITTCSSLAIGELKEVLGNAPLALQKPPS